ncbi:hypothetical protein [Flavihumibacter solisilvae]|uniref:Outer membrane protein beta-barrel domain-containing protein n=1 Tax=Flavihumibacter solisilvae TaxID=1349421 RepID=A0A0C1IYZ2_9BACT|nr:hypothetical protein [Flavihumibacter solisilvae]KIC95714.1 hypothetical protein OI18_05665 [Flavihumibacter solisilvae]
MKYLLSLLVMISCTVCRAQEKEKWRFLLEPYAMFPNMQGTTGLGNLPDASVDEDPSDIFSNLKIGAMLYAEAKKGKWSISSDLLYMDLNMDITSKNGIISGESDAKQLGWELAVLRKVLPWLEAGIGAQLNSIESGLDIVVNTAGGPSPQSKKITETWVDPTIIARLTYPLEKKWNVLFRGNVGGFGIGSDFSWQIQLYGGYRFSPLFQISAGYRAIGLDYETGSGNDRFLYDMVSFGPVVRFGFNF